MGNVIITGGTGIIGTKLSSLLSRHGYNVIVFTRFVNRDTRNVKNVTYLKWDIEQGMIDTDAIENADYIINLAGASVSDKRWTEEQKEIILQSRIQSCDLIVKALTEIPNKIKAVISVSGSGYYGSDNLLSLNDGFTEDDAASNDFLSNVCKEWEGSIEPVTSLGKRLVIFRVGMVLSKGGGAFQRFLKPLKFKVATILGNGKQIQSWIHEDDLCNMFLFALENEKILGVYNAVAPNPITNKVLVQSIARASSGFYIPFFVPEFILNSKLGTLAKEVLKSANLSSQKIEETGFTFMFPDIQEAANDLTNSV